MVAWLKYTGGSVCAGSVGRAQTLRTKVRRSVLLMNASVSKSFEVRNMARCRRQWVSNAGPRNGLSGQQCAASVDPIAAFGLNNASQTCDFRNELVRHS